MSRLSHKACRLLSSPVLLRDSLMVNSFVNTETYPNTTVQQAAKCNSFVKLLYKIRPLVEQALGHIPLRGYRRYKAFFAIQSLGNHEFVQEASIRYKVVFLFADLPLTNCSPLIGFKCTRTAIQHNRKNFNCTESVSGTFMHM